MTITGADIERLARVASEASAHAERFGHGAIRWTAVVKAILAEQEAIEAERVSPTISWTDALPKTPKAKPEIRRIAEADDGALEGDL